MNYAEDRLDRRARFAPGEKNALYQDYQHTLATDDQELLARILRDVGWNRHAVYHYARRWYQEPGSEQACGDLAQAAEFAGFAEVGVLALLAFKSRAPLCFPKEPGTIATDTCSTVHDEAWLPQPHPPLLWLSRRTLWNICMLATRAECNAIVDDLQEYHAAAVWRRVPASG